VENFVCLTVKLKVVYSSAIDQAIMTQFQITFHPDDYVRTW